MSVNYGADFGLGYTVTSTEELDNLGILDDGLLEYLQNYTGGDFWAFDSGCRYSGDVYGTYLTICNPLKHGLDLTEVKKNLDKEVIRLRLETIGEFGVVGGLLTY